MSQRAIVLDASEVALLQQWAQGNGRIAERSQIVLLSSQPGSAESVARRLGVAVPTVYKWRKRFTEGRLAGLRDLPRPGQPRRLNDMQRQEILRWTTERLAPEGHWTIRSLAAALEVSEHQVREVWATHSLRPHLLRSTRLTAQPKRDTRPPEPSLYATYRCAVLHGARTQQRTERRGERDAMLRAAARYRAEHLHIIVSGADLDDDCHPPLEPLLGPAISRHPLYTNEAWLSVVGRWLRAPKACTSTHAGRDLLASLVSHARRRSSLNSATFAWVAEAASPHRSAAERSAWVATPTL